MHFHVRIVQDCIHTYSENLTKSLPLSILPRGGRQPKQTYSAEPPEQSGTWGLVLTKFEGAHSRPDPPKM